MPDKLPAAEIEARFWARVLKTDTCWLWQGHITQYGYGMHYRGAAGKISAHRYSYLLWHKSIPDGLQLDHLCRVRHCVNPLHLEAVTARENVLRSLNPAAWNAIKTHCKAGHPYDAQNTLWRVSEYGRACKICSAERMRKWRAKRKIEHT